MGEELKKVVRVIPPTKTQQEIAKEKYRQLRVVAYCRVSTKMEEQLNSYETQVKHYTDKISENPNWTLVGIFADKGITGTSVKNRDEFKKMIRWCKVGKVDMIITKSISRFARNTLDCLKYTRTLKKYGVDVFFEEQGIHSLQPGAEFYITVFGSIAQSESENISANVKWGKAQSAKEGKVAFVYKRFLGYEKGEDGKPVIDEEQAEIIRFIYDRYLAGDSIAIISKRLEELKILSPTGKEKWSTTTVQSILSNEKYKGDAIINKTFVVDCISKEIRVNNGERPKYYVENNHPAIIDAVTFGRVQEELARRASKRKVKQVGTKTEQGKYSSKYALSELLVCGECKTPYRRCTWTIHGQKKVVWRCINRLDYGRKYCHKSSSVEEGLIHKAIMKAVQSVAQQDVEVLKTLKVHIATGLAGETTEDESIQLQVRIAEIDTEIKAMINAVSADNVNGFDDDKAQALIKAKSELQERLAQAVNKTKRREIAESRLDEIYLIMDGLKNRPLIYDNELIRKILECVVVISKEKIKVVFKGGLEIEQELEDEKVA